MARAPLLQLKDIHLTFGGTPLLEGAELVVGAGDRIGLVGRNGSGKSTLLRIAAGLVEADAGERFLDPGTTVRYLGQEPDLSAYPTTLAFVEAGLGPTDERHAAEATLAELGLTGEEAPARLSGGEARRAALAAVMAPDPDVLLLDEPTNHLDIDAIEWLEAALKARRKALVLISHDRRFLETLTSATVWLDRGTTRRLEKGFSAFEDWRDQVFEAEERERERLDKKIAAETEWLRKGVTARRKRNQGRLRNLEALRRQRAEARRAAGDVVMQASEGKTTGKRVIEAKGIGKDFGEGPVVADFSIRIDRGDRVAFVGPNGAGKTTLLKLLLGELSPDAGTVRHGTNLEIAYLDQRRDALAPGDTARGAITRGGGDTVEVGGQTKHVATYLKDFLFAKEQFDTPVTALSGGERARLLLARSFALPSNVLVLDEPTNDLDLETLDLLAELVADYHGTVLLVSHDRDFIDRTATSVVHAEGNGRWIEYAGGYGDMIAQRGARGPARAAPAKPRRDGAGERRQAASGEAGEAARKGRSAKLSFREKHDLETLPKRMEDLAREIARHERTLADPGLFERDPDAFEMATAALCEAQAALEAAEERWLELEIKREELAAG